MESKDKFIILILIGFLLYFITSVYTCNYYKDKEEVSRLKLRDTIGNFTKVKSKLMDTIYKQDQLITEFDKAKESGVLTKKEIAFLKEQNLKKDATILKLKSEINIPEQIIKYDTIIETKSLDASLYMKIPITFSENDKWFKINGVIGKEGVSFRELSIISEPTITIGIEQKNIFSKKIPKVIYTDANPYVDVTKMDNVVLKKQKKWWQRDITKIGIGILIGGALL